MIDKKHYGNTNAVTLHDLMGDYAFDSAAEFQRKYPKHVFVYVPEVPAPDTDPHGPTLKIQTTRRPAYRRAQDSLVIPLVRKQTSFVPIITIGRYPANDIIIPSAHVSRVHATLSTIDDVFFITDSNTDNGTFINGHPISTQTAHVLQNGDHISLGGPHAHAELTYYTPLGLTGFLEYCIDQQGRDKQVGK